jgi:heterodisulfide reductase subunit A
VTSKPGIFVCGAFASPKEIAETILDASGAAAESMRILRDHLGDREFSRAQPFLSENGLPSGGPRQNGEREVSVFLCECAGEISEFVDLSAVADRTRSLPGVRDVEILPLACQPVGRARLSALLRDGHEDRFVIGACSHRTHEPLFQRVAAEAGINPYMLEMVNLREHCAWVHPHDPVGATRKAAELIRIGVQRVRLAQPISKLEREPKRAALVIGGGVSGMTAALGIADAGYDVHLVEKKAELGGNLHHIHYVAEGDNPGRLLRDLVNRVLAHERVHIYLNSEVTQHTGSVGDFRASIRSIRPSGEARSRQIQHGVVILATGGNEAGGEHYLLGKDHRVVRQSELEEIIAHQPERISSLNSIVMIQCVEPFEEVEYCSRICCTNTIKNALRIKMLNPKCQVVILYRDIITYGFREKYYLDARRRGVLFVRYTTDHPPQVDIVPHGARQALRVSVNEHIFGQTLEFEPDLLALSTAVLPSPDNRQLAEMLGVSLSTEGFFLEAHLKMRPMDFADEGIYVAGMAHFPKFIEESITHSMACVGRALTVLSRSQIQLGGVVAEVEGEKCTGCLTCVRTCPFGIPEMRYDQNGVGDLGGAAWIDPARCQGCGTCTGECPARAIQLMHYRDEQISVGLGEWDSL